MSAARASQAKISSIGFSGAGFLAAYHLGVAQCLLDQNVLNADTLFHRGRQHHQRAKLALTGVSAGALVSTALFAGIQPADGMQASLRVAQQTRASGILDAFQPGFSLIDVVEELFGALLRKAVPESEWEEFSKVIEYGKLLRIGLTDRRVFPSRMQNSKAFCYVETYRDLEDIIAACILSSYIPGVTGPTLGALDRRHSAVLRAADRLHDMIEEGCVKQGSTGEPVLAASNRKGGREVAWDGGLANGFPFFDEHTLIVSPLAADFKHAAISPAISYAGRKTRAFPLSPDVRLHLTAENLLAFRYITMSSDEAVLQSKYALGYDNAKVFLAKYNLTTVYHQLSPGLQLAGKEAATDLADAQ